VVFGVIAPRANITASLPSLKIFYKTSWACDDQKEKPSKVGTKHFGHSNEQRLFSLLQGGIEMCPAQVNDEFEVTINETNVTAVHREHKHKYLFSRLPNSPQLGPATWQENLSAERGAQDYIDSAHEAARLELQRAGILAGSEI
jgi:hypothetical protein